MMSSMCMTLMILRRQKYIQLSHYYLNLSVLMLKLIWKSYKMSRTGQVTAELIKVGGEILRSEIHKRICSIWNKEELPQQWKESIILPIHKKDGKTDYNNYRGISLLSTAYKTVLQAKLTPLCP